MTEGQAVRTPGESEDQSSQKGPAVDNVGGDWQEYRQARFGWFRIGPNIQTVLLFLHMALSGAVAAMLGWHPIAIIAISMGWGSLVGTALVKGIGDWLVLHRVGKGTGTHRRFFFGGAGVALLGSASCFLLMRYLAAVTLLQATGVALYVLVALGLLVGRLVGVTNWGIVSICERGVRKLWQANAHELALELCDAADAHLASEKSLPDQVQGDHDVIRSYKALTFCYMGERVAGEALAEEVLQHESRRAFPYYAGAVIWFAKDKVKAVSLAKRAIVLGGRGYRKTLEAQKEIGPAMRDGLMGREDSGEDRS